MEKTLHQPSMPARPASTPPNQVGSGLHRSSCWPCSSPVSVWWRGRRSRASPLARTPDDVVPVARDYRLGTQVSSPAGSLQEILAHPDLIPTHDHPLLGRQAPDFELADPDGKAWNLRELQAGGPVVLIFYYGYHCNHCVRQLFDVNRDLPLFREVGAQVVAISADPPELTRRRFEQNGPFGFPVLSDPENKVGTSLPGVQAPQTERTRTSASATGLSSSTGMARFSGSMSAMRRSVAIQPCSVNWPRWKAVYRRYSLGRDLSCSAGPGVGFFPASSKREPYVALFGGIRREKGRLLPDSGAGVGLRLVQQPGQHLSGFGQSDLQGFSRVGRRRLLPSSRRRHEQGTHDHGHRPGGRVL